MRSTSHHMRSESIMLLRFPRTLQLIFGLLSFSLFASAQISLVHVTSCGPQTFPSSMCTIPATGSGDLLVVGWASNDGGSSAIIANVTDNAGNVYTEAGNARATDTAGNTMSDIWYAKGSVAGSTVLTVTPNPVGTGTVVIWEFSGADPNSPLDQTAVLDSQAGTLTPTGASVVIASNGEVIVAVSDTQGTVTGIASGNAFVNDSGANGDGWSHLITSTVGTYTPQWNNATSGTYCASTVSFKAAGSGGGACDLNQDGTVNVEDVQVAVNMDLGLLTCPTNLDGGVCGSTLVTQIVNAALGQGCSATVSHSVSLTWTASVSANIAGYYVYRSTTNGGPYTQLTSALVAGTAYLDSNVTAGQTYYYVLTAVDISNDQSAYSTQAQATVPST